MIERVGWVSRMPTEMIAHAQDLVESVSDMSKANDWFLVAPDFTDYMRAAGDRPFSSTQLSAPHACFVVVRHPDISQI